MSKDKNPTFEDFKAYHCSHCIASEGCLGECSIIEMAKEKFNEKTEEVKNE